MNCFVIMQNDYPDSVVIGGEQQADSIKEELAADYHAKTNTPRDHIWWAIRQVPLFTLTGPGVPQSKRP